MDQLFLVREFLSDDNLFQKQVRLLNTNLAGEYDGLKYFPGLVTPKSI